MHVTRSKARAFGSWVSARELSIRRKAFSGFRPVFPHRKADAGSSGSKVNTVAPSARSVSRSAHRSTKRSVGRACE